MRVLCVVFLMVSLSIIAVGRAEQEGSDSGFAREDFPEGFVFGSGTSAYQVEGAAAEDGRTPSIWDTFCHSGKVADKSTGDIACDGYHKYKEDINLMAETGLEAYRFSISWSRLIPNGRGPINPLGLQYYNNLINELINHGNSTYAFCACLEHFPLLIVGKHFMYSSTLDPLQKILALSSYYDPTQFIKLYSMAWFDQAVFS